MILVHTLGTALIDAGACPIKPNSPRKFALLLHLSAERGRRISRASLQELIFPDQPEKNARHSLREVVYQLRQFGVVLDTSLDGVELIADQVQADYEAIIERETLDPEQVRAAAGGFLPGYSPLHSESYTEWYEAYRARSISGLTRALLKEVDRARNAGQWDSTERAARACLALDPLNEPATVALAEMLFLAGSKAKATKLLDDYMEEVGRIDSDLKQSVRVLRRRMEQGRENAPSRFNPRFVGRDDEMKTLRETLRRSLRGEAHCVVVSGEPGIGKSRLLSEFRSIVELEGVHCETVAMQPHDLNRPMGAFVDLVPTLLRLRGAVGCSPDSMAALKRLTSSRSSDTSEKREQLEVEAVSFAVTSAIVDLCQSITAEQPLALLIEDSHSLDQYSINVLLALLAVRPEMRLIILVSTREARRLRSTFRFSDRSVTITLKPLPTHATEVLIDDIISPPAPPEARTQLVRAANGNPLFALSVANQYRQCRDIEAVPTTLVELLARRLDPLSNVALSVLTTCIALGKHCNTDRLVRALDVAPVVLLDAVAELNDHGLVDAQSEHVTPAHPLIAEVLGTRSLPAMRNVVSFRVAQVFEHDARLENSPAFWWEAGNLWRDAGESERALSAFRECARHTMDIGHAADAARILSDAVALRASSGSTIEAARELVLAADLSADTRLVLQGYNLLRGALLPEQHDDLELAARRAAIRDVRLPEQVFEKTVRCLHASDATPEHRVLAATLGLKAACVAENSGPIVASLEQHISPDDLSIVDEDIRLEFELLLRTLKEDWNAVEGIAGQIMIAAARGKLSRRAALQRNCGIAFGLAGKPRAAIAAFEQAYEATVMLRCYSLQGRVASLIAGVYADLFDDESWDTWNARAEEAVRHGTGIDESPDLQIMQICRSFVGASIELTEALLNSASRRGAFVGSPTRERWGEAFVLLLRAKKSETTKADEERAHNLLLAATHTISGVRDFEVAAAAATIAERDPRSALGAIRKYLREDRHGRQMVDRQLAEVIRELEMRVGAGPGYAAPKTPPLATDRGVLTKGE